MALEDAQYIEPLAKGYADITLVSIATGICQVNMDTNQVKTVYTTKPPDQAVPQFKREFLVNLKETCNPLTLDVIRSQKHAELLLSKIVNNKVQERRPYDTSRWEGCRSLLVPGQTEANGQIGLVGGQDGVIRYIRMRNNEIGHFTSVQNAPRPEYEHREGKTKIVVEKFLLGDQNFAPHSD